MLKRFFLVFFAVISFKAYSDVRIPITGEWKYKIGDNLAYAAVDFDDSSWTNISLENKTQLNGQNYLWLRKTVEIPSSLVDKRLFIDLGNSKCAFEVFINGDFLDTYGDMPPGSNINDLFRKSIAVPTSAMKDGTVHIALRVWTPASYIRFRGIKFTDESIVSEIFSSNLLNIRFYFTFAVLCLFVGLYYIALYLKDRTELPSFFYALSLICISFYFLGMGSEKTLVFSYTLERVFTQTALPVSLGFLLLFLLHYTKTKVYKIYYTFQALLIVVAFAANLIFHKNTEMQETIFTLGLIPCAFVLVVGLIIIIKAFFKKQKDIAIILIGFILGTFCGIYDMAHDISDKIPFFWLQGYGFFILILSIFIALAMHSNRMKIANRLYSQEIKDQSESLTETFATIRHLIQNIASMSNNLKDSMAQLKEASEQNSLNVIDITVVMGEQKNHLLQTEDAINNLLTDISDINQSIERTNESIQNTASSAVQLITGFSSVSEGVKGAASFADTLNRFAGIGAQNMKNLSTTMGKVQEASREILNVVSVLDDFASRTNLLAMNASIEAAHAGIAGKGFSVVANEIKSLAAASSVQAGKISDIVKEIKTLIEQSVELSDSVNESFNRIEKESSTTAEHVQRAADDMVLQEQAGKTIINEIKALTNLSRDMKESTSSQQETSEKVSNDIANLTEVSNKVENAVSLIANANTSLETSVVTLTTIATQAQSIIEEMEKIALQ